MGDEVNGFFDAYTRVEATRAYPWYFSGLTLGVAFLAAFLVGPLSGTAIQGGSVTGGLVVKSGCGCFRALRGIPIRRANGCAVVHGASHRLGRNTCICCPGDILPKSVRTMDLDISTLGHVFRTGVDMLYRPEGMWLIKLLVL